MAFDPYHRWLAIPPGPRPPTYYQLLGVTPDEADAEVIEEAALRQASHVRTYQTGPHASLCTALLNEIGQARATLLNPEKRRAYDGRLTARVGSTVPEPAPFFPPDPGPAVASFPFAADAVETEVPQPRRRRAVATISSGASLAVVLYLALLFVGAGLGFWAGRAALANSDAPLGRPPAFKKGQVPGQPDRRPVEHEADR